ncbi:MAG TPA: Ig-like domain-containing protein [Gemmatimonadaceae bacterium]
MHSVSRSLLVAGIVALGGLTACGDKVQIVQPTNTPTGKDSSVTSVTVTPSTAQTQVGGTQTFVASVVGGPDLTNRNVTWSSSNTAVATISAAGVATAVSAGQTTIIAKSSANPSVQGAAVLTVTAIAPASLSFFGVNNQFGNPATLNNVNGQLNVIANVDPGQSGLTNLQLLLICPKATGTGSDTTVVGSSNVAGTTGTQTGQQVTIPFNTAAFNQVTGAATYRNGTCSLSLSGRNAAGAQVISSTGPALTLNNTDIVAGTIVGARNATDAAGLRWDGGAVTVTVLPVLYSGQTPSTLNVTISGTDTDGAGAVAVTAAATKDANGVWTATFTEGTTAAPAAPAIGNVYTIPALTATVTGVNSAGQPISAGAMAVNTVPSVQTGGATAASIRYDNEDPANPTYTFATQNPNYAAGAGFINGSYAFNSTMTAGQGFGNLGTAAAGCAPGTTLCDHNGVDKVTAAYSYTTANPAAAGSSYTAITTASAIPETSSGTAYGFRVQSCDALSNCASLLTGERFGVDITTPVITNVAAPINNEGQATPGALNNGGNLTITAVDSASVAGVTGSGFGATPVTATLTRVIASGASGQTTQCVDILTGVASAVPAAGCASQTFGFGQALPAGTIDDAAEYTLSYSVSDMAGNVTATGTRKFQVDAQAPTVTGGISIPATVTSGTSFTTTASDSTDIATSAGAQEYTTLGVRIVQPATAAPTGVIGDGSLTRASTITYTPGPFYGQLQQFTAPNVAGAADNLDQIRIRARDVIGNTSADQVVALPAANVTTGTAFAAAPGIQAFTVTSSNNTIFNGAGATPAGRSTTTNLTAAVDVGASTGASPFSNVCFYYQSNGGAGQGGAVAGEWVLIGCQSAAAVTQVGANRVFNYTVSGFDPAASFPAGAVNVVAIGSNGNAGLISTAGTATITP